ncbi:hypothetical protein EAY39_15335 [Vibrio anguillarum]|uniref:hypothetical protein n=1 Tax=Vibrio anguillarum TaxID=55601 RepID=UPI0018C32AF4|nr:hypothetical protein [Vibrio anguillarum]MBF4342137.1 hypothetical protein [Vibrio anguillarum]
MKFTTISLYARWGAAISIMLAFAFFDLGKSENSSYFAIIYLLLTAPEIIKKICFAMGKSAKLSMGNMESLPMKKETNNLDSFEPTGLGELSGKLRENGIKVDFSEQEQSTTDKVLSTPPADVDLKEVEKQKKRQD